MKLLQIEFMKLKGNRSFWVFSILFLVFLPVLILLLPATLGGEVNGIRMYPLVPSTAGATWYMTCLVSSYFSMFILSFIIIYHIVNEFVYRTVRQNVIDGLTRWEFAKAKFYLLLTIAVLATLYVFLNGLIAVIYFDSLPREVNFMDMMQNMTGKELEPIPFGGLLDGVHNLIGYFIQIIGYFSFAVFISFLFKKGAMSVLVYFSAFVLEIIVIATIFGTNYSSVARYFPLRSISNILPNPNFETLFKGLSTPNEITLLNISIILVYSFLFLFFSNYLFQKRDIS